MRQRIPRNSEPGWQVAGLTAILLLLAGCHHAPTPGDIPPPPTSTPAAQNQLDHLDIHPRQSNDSTYTRRAFGPAWKDIDHNGCNQRDDVLQRDASPGTLTVGRQGRCNHDVLAGTWIDPYTGATITLTDAKAQAQQVVIDHVLPLSEAWKSGANTWTIYQRTTYANTLANLRAVAVTANSAKGDSDPAAWRPRKAHQCRYATLWIQIKTTWRLAVDPAEKAALEQMLSYCVPQ